MLRPLTIVSLVLLCLSVIAAGAEPAAIISPPRKDPAGFLVNDITCPFEAGVTHVRALLPDPLIPGKTYRVIYVLPVETGEEHRFGDGLGEVQKLNLQNTTPAIFVEPTFSHLPWYADHPSDPQIRQESYFLKVVVPLVERQYPAQNNAAGRLLLGFSKSGWGAISLLLRHPDLFSRAVAWDAPLMMAHPDHYGMAGVFATQTNFQKYQISRLLEDKASQFRAADRFILLGYGNFRDQMQAAHELMVKLKISHQYRDGPQRQHKWSSGWLPQAVKLVAAQP